MQRKPDLTDTPHRPALERRSFIHRAGIALSAAAAAAPGLPGSETDATGAMQEQLRQLSYRLGVIEDMAAVRELHNRFADHLNTRRYPSLVELFAADAAVHFHGGIFQGRDQGVHRLYVEHFGRTAPAAMDAPLHATVLSRLPHRDTVEVAPDRRSGSARFHSLVRVEADLPDVPLVAMARQQGQGIIQWWEEGVFESNYVKVGDAWKIHRLDYRPAGRVDGPEPVISREI